MDLPTPPISDQRVALKPVELAEYHVRQTPFTEVEVYVVGYEHPETGEYEWYDLFVTPPGGCGHGQICINEGDPLTEWPTFEDALHFWQPLEEDYVEEAFGEG